MSDSPFCFSNKQGSLFHLRQWQPKDYTSLTQSANNPNISRMLRNRFPCPYTEKDAKEFISYALLQPPPYNLLNLAIVSSSVNVELENDRVIGGISIVPGSDIHARNAELGYWLAEDSWGTGIATRAVQVMLKNVLPEYNRRISVNSSFSSSISTIHRVWAGCKATNAASRRILESSGFSLDCILKQSIWKEDEFHDECMYSLI